MHDPAVADGVCRESRKFLVCEGFWVSSGAPIVRGGFGARPFFLTSESELRAAPPPAFGSTRYLADLAEVRAISDRRTAEQLVTDAFPSERALIEQLEQEGGMSRIYGGIHYPFDIEVGHAIGRAVARLALERRGLE